MWFCCDEDNKILHNYSNIKIVFFLNFTLNITSVSLFIVLLYNYTTSFALWEY